MDPFPNQKPRLEKQLFGRLIPSHRAGAPSGGWETAATATGKKRGVNRPRSSTDTPLGWGVAAAWGRASGPGPGYGRGAPTEGSLLGGEGESTSCGGGQVCWGSSTKGLWVQEYSRGPATWPGSPEAPTALCVSVSVCVSGKVGPFPPSSATPAGWWAPGEGGSSLPPTHQPGFSSSTSTAAPASNQWSQITFRRAGPGLG